jgi:hypothetical protein
MGMFGALKRKPMFGEVPGMGQPPMQQPPMVGAMQPDMGAMTKKPNFFQKNGNTIIGVIGDTLATLGGGQGVYAPAMIAQKQQDAEIRARLQAALEQRKAAREDYTWKAEYDRANPKPANDKLAMYMRNAGIDPESEQGKAMYNAALTNEIYPEKMIPFTDAQGNEGLMRTRTGMPPQQGSIQEGATATNPKTNEKIIFRNGQWQPVGGSVGNGTEGFPNWY